MLEHGYDAVRISGQRRAPPRGQRTGRGGDEDRLGTLGRATLRTLTAVDQGARLERGPDTYVLAVSQVVPGWALALLAGTLLLPVLAVSVDAFARARRRRVAVLPWMRWIGAWAAAFLCAARDGRAAGAGGRHTRSTAGARRRPSDMPLDGPALAVLGASAWRPRWRAGCWRRRLAVRPEPELADPTDPGAGVALALALVAAAVLLWLLNPYAALLAVPAAHLWTLTALTRPAAAAAGAGRAGGARRPPGRDRLALLPVRPVARPAGSRLVPAAARGRPLAWAWPRP